MAAPDDQSPNLVGELIRQQRELAALPLRQLAALTGISNPYLSQIEHGLRAPSADVMASIAKTLGIPLRALRPETDGRHDVPAPEPEADEPASLLTEIRRDPALTPQQRRALAEIYTAMTEVTASSRRRRQG
jgi:transcriptional regulator with XRE-family HTH domain